jgi:L-ribulose-5-phosphate 3-epimerase
MEKQKKSLAIMEKAVKLAADLGIRTIQLAGYDVYYEESTEKTRADFVKNLKIAAEMAGKEGIQMGFETMETPFMDNVKKAMEYVQLVDSPYLGVYPDSGNITNAALLYDDDVTEDLKRGKGHIVAVHLKETVPGKYREIPFGTGHVDFEQVIKTSWELGVRRYVAEFWYLDGQDYKAELKKASEFMRSRLDKMN